jgi:hypothetical protein
MAWERWQQWSADLMNQRRQLDHTMRRFLNRKLRIEFARWQEWYADLQLLKKHTSPLWGALRLRRMHQRQFSMAWERWKERYADFVAETTGAPNPLPARAAAVQAAEQAIPICLPLAFSPPCPPCTHTGPASGRSPPSPEPKPDTRANPHVQPCPHRIPRP